LFWSPDGRYLAEFRTDPEHPTLWDIPENRPITLPTLEAREIVWSPDSQQFAYTDAERGGMTVYHISAGEIFRDEGNNSEEYVIEWSSDSRLIVSYNFSDTDETIPMIRDVYQKTTQILSQSSDYRWSPAGRYLAYVAYESESRSDSFQSLYLWDSQDQSSRLLYTQKTSYIYGFGWSPNSEWLAFTLPESIPDNDEEQPDLGQGVVINIASAQAYESILELYPMYYFSSPFYWSSDAKYLALWSDEKRLIFDTTQQTWREVAELLGDASIRGWSKDSASLILTDYGTGNNDLYSLSISDFSLQNLTNTPDVYETLLGLRGTRQGYYSLIYCGEG
jgi:Tol biopolymer transport system component